MLSNVCETFHHIGHILGDKTNINKFKNTKILQSILSDYNKIKQTKKVNNREIHGKVPSIWKSRNILLNNPYVKEKVSRETGKYFT